MKSIFKTTALFAIIGLLSLNGVNATDADVDQDDQEPIAEPVIKEKEVVSPYKLKGTYEPKVHMLSQLSEPHPAVKVTTVFTEVFPSNGVSEVLRFKPGTSYRLVFGIENFGTESIILKTITGALVDVQLIKPDEPPKYTYSQNFTVDSLESKEVPPSTTFSLSYDFTPFSSLKTPAPYTLQFAIFYQDSKFAYSSLPFNHPVYLLESDQSVNILATLISVGISSFFLLIFAFVIFVKLQDRYFPREARSLKKGQKLSVYETVRELISNQQY